jgi:6-phosphogluconolactonase
MKILAGSYNQSSGTAGIHIANLEEQSGVMEYIMSKPAGKNPSWIEWDQEHRILFCVNETGILNGDGGSVTVLDFSGIDGPGNHCITIPGVDPCHLAYDRRDRVLFTADYSSGTVSRIYLDDRFIPVDSEIFVRHAGSGPVSGRQDSAHIHAVYSRPEGLWCSDLGTDTLRLYEPRNAEIITEIRTPPGAGPRMILWSNPDRLYVVAELSNGILLYRRSGVHWHLAEQWSTLDPEDQAPNTASCAVLDERRGAFYVANRGQDNIAVFRIRPDAELKLDGHVKLRVRCPRHFILTPGGKFLIAAGQDCGRLEVFDIDENAHLVSRGLNSGYGHPACLVALSEDAS